MFDSLARTHRILQAADTAVGWTSGGDNGSNTIVQSPETPGGNNVQLHASSLAQELRREVKCHRVKLLLQQLQFIENVGKWSLAAHTPLQFVA